MSTLVVPIEVQALVVPTTSASFRTWIFDYGALNAYNSPEPAIGGGQSSFLPRPLGTYLHWDLPTALRHGTSDSQGGPVVYPPVPNRWLVLRRSGPDRAATGWVVESDCPNSTSTAYYLVDQTILDAWTASGEPNRVQGAKSAGSGSAGTLHITRLGSAFPLAGWQERAATATFLTAVAPGNVLFSAYETHCSGVFTFYDSMAGVSAGDVVSYRWPAGSPTPPTTHWRAPRQPISAGPASTPTTSNRTPACTRDSRSPCRGSPGAYPRHR